MIVLTFVFSKPKFSPEKTSLYTILDLFYNEIEGVTVYLLLCN